MTWSERQRAMLRAMGLPVWAPPPGSPAMAPGAAPEPAATLAAPIEAPRTVGRPESPIAPPMVSAAAPRRDVDTMDWPALRAAVSACRACALCEGRTQTVFGVGNQRAHWMIVGEAPGEQEDLKGEPFVGAAGQLLDAMLRALGLARSEGPPERQVFIANTLKCRPPRNRNPEPSELAQCEPFLRRQIALVQPRIILAMGRFAVQSLLRSDDAIGRLRGRVHRYEGVPLVVTYHPAYLLRQPSDKAKAWDDLCLAASVLDR
ncbi:MAG TPA: uracil-DNA glycosylase [Ideonella sp.]|nr:uracil-DNA glycosylase [Ideonella sp.]